jgi:predicted nucleic acid-binding protein
LAVLDTSVMVDAFFRSDPRLREPAVAVLRSLQDSGEVMCTTRICVAELMVGLQRTGHRRHETDVLSRVLRETYVLEFDQGAAEHFAIVKAGLLDRGTPIGDMDALIASIALANDQRVVTRNPRDFERVPNLRVVSYG